MSHYTVLVIGENPEEQLAPFDENKEMESYIRYTKEELIEDSKNKVKEFANSTYAEYLADPEKYKENCHNEGHLKYIEFEFPQKMSWTDEQHYQDAIKYYEPEELTENGDVISTYNPNSKWDWYCLGGRWTGIFKLKQGTQGEVGRPGIMTEEARIGYVDQAYKRDIYVEYMKL
jgi:hypothetical protein